MIRPPTRLALAVVAALAAGQALAWASGNRFGGSTSHSFGSTSHENRYGGSSTHTAGQGTEHTNTYGGSTAHSEYGGTEHTNVYGGSTSGAYGAGATHSTYYGATAYRPPAYGTYPVYHPPTCVPYYSTGCYGCAAARWRRGRLGRLRRDRLGQHVGSYHERIFGRSGSGQRQHRCGLFVTKQRFLWATACAALLGLAGCASRPGNPPITQVDPKGGYTFQTRQTHFKNRDTLVVLAFSGGGTRAAAFSYGVLEFLQRTQVVAPDGSKLRLLDAVDMITGVSGSSFTALAYGLYGDKLFADHEQRFLKRDVQGELVARALSPRYWADYIGGTAGRSKLAANYYDEILFGGATFGDLDRGDGPYIVASATDISSGSRVPFNQSVFNLMCSDLNSVRLARAAAASSAVPVVLSTVTLNNYGGSCKYEVPAWVTMFTQSDDPPRPAARAIRELNEARVLADGVNRPYIHLVDGGVSDNVGMRGVLDALQLLEALHAAASRRRSTM